MSPDVRYSDRVEGDVAKRREERDPAGLLPLTPPAFHVLLALAGRELHGYGIRRDVERRTEGQVVLGPGTLYGLIKRLVADGLIEESGERPDPEFDDERRRYYRLTGFGERVASAEAARLESLVREARARRLLPARES
jgi:DNA-binding PadR family transcriptional regulator